MYCRDKLVNIKAWGLLLKYWKSKRFLVILLTFYKQLCEIPKRSMKDAVMMYNCLAKKLNVLTNMDVLRLFFPTSYFAREEPVPSDVMGAEL